MFKLLAFLLILCVLFGVETTRELFFGAVGFIFWAIVIVVGIGLLALGLRDGRTPEEKKKDEELEAKRKKEMQHGPNDKIAYFLLALFLVAVAIIFIVMGK